MFGLVCGAFGLVFKAFGVVFKPFALGFGANSTVFASFAMGLEADGAMFLSGAEARAGATIVYSRSCLCCVNFKAIATRSIDLFARRLNSHIGWL